MTPVLAEIQAFPNQFFVDELPRGGTEQERTRLRDPFLRLSSRLPGNSTAAPQFVELTVTAVPNCGK